MKAPSKLNAMLLGLSALLPSFTLCASETAEGSIAIYLDNDLFAGSDSDYTNGTRISFISKDKAPSDLPAIQSQLRRLAGDLSSWGLIQDIAGLQEPESIRYQWGLALTQLMFTPESLTAAKAPKGERPYAGWLGLGFSLHIKDPHALNSVELTLGIVGPSSFAKEAQDFVHDVRGFARFEGWDSQIPNEATLNLNFRQKRRMRFIESIDLPVATDGFLELGGELGTFRTAASIGSLIRFGYNLPVDFSDPRISLTANTQSIVSDLSTNSGTLSLYGLLGGRCSAVLHDITLDGPLFRNFDTGVSSKALVGEYYLGFGMRWGRWEMSYAHTWRSKEFDTQLDAQSFGSVVLRTSF